MFFNSVSSDERFNSSASDTLRSHSVGADAGELSEHIAARRLARSYWMAVTLGTMLTIIMIVFSAVAISFDFKPVGIFYAVVVGNILFILNVLRIYRKHYDAANEYSCIATGVIESLSRENLDLQQDVEHWKALSFTKRGGLSVVKDGTAAGISCSDKQEAPAAVVPFPTDGDAA